MSLQLPKNAFSSRYMLAIDGDIIAYSCAAAGDGHYWETPDKDRFRYKKDAVAHCVLHGIKYGGLSEGYDPDPINHVLHSVKILLESIFEATESKDYIIYLSGDRSFRREMYPDYKSHRDDIRKPHHLQAVKDYLFKYYNVEVASDGREADDLLANFLIRNQDRGCLCSLDKDLNQVPGTHYNWVKKSLYTVDRDTATKNFYKQFLTGDRADNIVGVNGIGDVKAEKIIGSCNDVQEMEDCILYLYDGDFDKFKKNYILLKVGD